MTHIDDVFDLDLLAHEIERGMVNVRTHPDFPQLSILNYSPTAAWENEWNDITSATRGLIYNTETGEVLARPFHKFFNYGQEGAPLWSPDALVCVTDKADGSLGILYTTPDGREAIATRGSFASEQAVWATDLYRTKYEGAWQPHPDYTYLFEIIYPENRIVVDYGDMADLMMIGAVRVSDGRSAPVECAADLTRWPGPVVESFADQNTEMSFAVALSLDTRENREGYVFWNPITDERVKIKFEDYKALHKLFTNTNEKAIWEILSEGRDTAEIFAAAPDEFHEWMKGVIRRLKNSYATIETEALFIWRLIQSRLPEGYSRKEFAQMVQSAKREFQGMIFALEDGKSISPTIWKMVKPSGGATMRAVNMDAD